MKKYIKPAVEIIEVDTTDCIMDTINSMGMSETDVKEYYQSRNRGAAWTDYEGN